MASSVYTLTDTTPVREHIQLLEKGLKFIPTNERWDQDQWNEDIEQFIRKLKTRWHFRKHEQDPDMLIYILDTESDKFERLVKEMCWIEIMRPSDPNKGMTKFTC